MVEGFVSDEAAALYRSLLLTAASAPSNGNIDTRALAELQALGLAFRTPGTPPHVVAASPDDVLDRMLAMTRQEVMARQHELERILGELDALQRRRAEPAISGAAPIELVTDPVVLRGVAEQLAAETTREYAAVVSNPLLDWPLPVDSDGPITACRVRLLYALAEPPTMPRRIESRMTSMTRLDLRISDGRKALIARPDPFTPTLLIVRSSVIAALLQHWFELLWSRGTPPEDAAPTTGPYRQRILRLLAAGYRDADVARSTSTSIRTVRRHIAAIMDEVGASTRFEVCIVARRRGWLDL